MRVRDAMRNQDRFFLLSRQVKELGRFRKEEEEEMVNGGREEMIKLGDTVPSFGSFGPSSPLPLGKVRDE